MSAACPIVAAPLAGISNRAWREIARAHGADIAYGEMVSARAIAYGNKRTLELMDIEGEAEPIVVQLSGSEPEFIRLGAELAVSLGAGCIDLNMGCPVPKVARNNEGAMLMRDLPLAARIIAAARQAGKPVTVKFRAGWDKNSVNAVEFARMAEQAGAAALTVHGRTRDQFYSGQADWSIIASVKRAVSIPVLGNGDIFSAADALAMREQTGCDGLMIGRGALGNPWLFGEVQAALQGLPPPPRPNPPQLLEQALAHLRRQSERAMIWVCAREGDSRESRLLAENLTVRALRGHLGWYTKGLRHAAALRQQLNQQTTVAAVEALFADYLNTLSALDKQQAKE